jgi:hypothetical protein
VPGSSLSTQVFPSQDYSTIAPDSFIQLSWTLRNLISCQVC